MRDQIWHPERQLMIDFGARDFGGPRQTEVIQAWRDRGHRVAYRGEFICWRHRDHEHPELHLRQHPTGMVAAHYANSGVEPHEIRRGGPSPEHERQVEYLQLAGEAAGFTVATEVVIPGARPDAVIYGPAVAMGVEAQRSDITRAEAKRRTTRARRADILPVWFTDWKSSPRWWGQVPGLNFNPDVLWEELPPRRTVFIKSGTAEIEMQQCRYIYDGRCANHNKGCSERHPLHVGPILNLTADEVAERLPVGDLVAMEFRKTSTAKPYVVVVSAEHKARYESATGIPADLPLVERQEQLRRGQPSRCGASIRTVGFEKESDHASPAHVGLHHDPCSYDYADRGSCMAEGALPFFDGTRYIQRCYIHRPNGASALSGLGGAA